MALERTETSCRLGSWQFLLAAVFMGAAAGGMGWGIRGQYGHEWGALVPGVLVSFVMVFLVCPGWTPLNAARAVALGAIGFSFGGVMTYGQTVGLTHDRELVGNYEAFRWGMIGLAVKGGLWIGFGGAFLGMGLGGKTYRWKEFVVVYIALLALVFIGIRFINEPYQPDVTSPDRALPTVYFSDHWDWEPNKLDMKPRRECWGGLAAAFVGLLVYLGLVRRDTGAVSMGAFGFLAGAFGFPTGQWLQSKHSWTPGWLAEFDAALHTAVPGIFPETFFSRMGFNWWNMMETTFGAVMGATLGVGLWCSRRFFDTLDEDRKPQLSSAVEWITMTLFAIGLILWAVFRADESIDWLARLADFPLLIGLLPVIGILGGQYWPYMFSLTFIAVAIAGITLKATADGEHWVTDSVLLVVLPVGIMLLATTWFVRQSRLGLTGRSFTRFGLILSVLVYCSLNFVFFGCPWGVLPENGRHTNNWIFLRCTELLIFGALAIREANQRPSMTVRN